MGGSRSSNTRLDPSTESAKANGSAKRKADSAGSSSKAQAPAEKKQKTLDEVAPEIIEKEVADEDLVNGAEAKTSSQDDKDTEVQRSTSAQDDSATGKPSDLIAVESEADDKDSKEKSKHESTDAHSTNETNGGAIETCKEREDGMPSSIMEKGIFYFFVKGRVGVDNAQGAGDIARSYFVLRPLPDGAKLGHGELQDLANNRLLALPKKVLPRSHQDRFMTFVEKSGVTLDELKTEFMQGSEYVTKTTGVNHTPPATTIGEGVYALTTTGRESHFAYLLTIPSEPGEVQEEMGLRDKGSFVISLKNPERPGPANASLPRGPEFPDEILEEFRGRAWMPPEAKHFNYPNAQFLLIGEGVGDLRKAGKPQSAGQGDAPDAADEHIAELQHEDQLRVEGLKGDDSVFDDLGLSKKDYPKVQTTW